MSEKQPTFGQDNYSESQIPSALEQNGFVELTQQIDLVAELSSMRDDFGLSYGKLYVFGFHSKLKDGIDQQSLEEFDESALLEVSEADGFIAYHPGERGLDGRALSWCLWKSIEHSHQGSKAEAHLAAVNAAKYYYQVGVAEYLAVDFKPDGTRVSTIMPPRQLHL